MISNKPFSETPGTLADQAVQSTDNAIRSGQRMANEAIDRLADKVQDVRDQAAPVLNRVAAKAEELARRSADAVRDSSQQLRDKAVRVSDNTVGYVKDEPMKAILMAAAAGAALMALLTLLGRSSRGGD